MSFARQILTHTVVFTAVIGLATGCANQHRQTTTPLRTAEKTEKTSQPKQPPRFASQQTPMPARFAGAVSLYGELVRREGGLAPVSTSENLRQVTASREGADFDVAVDPKSERLCFASTRHSTTANLYLRSVDGSTVTQLTNEAGNDVMPTFSPDGKYIAFASDRSGTWNIFLQPIEGGKAIQITDDPSQELHPSFSPDAKQIVFSALSNRSGQWEMVVVDVENPSKRRFIGFGLFPKFSPDGKKIAFQRARQRGSRTFSVWTVDYADGEATRPTEIAAAGNAAVITPAWSPDGKRLAFATVVDPSSHDVTARPREAELWMIDLDGNNRVRLTQDMHANLQPAWASDGTLYFISNRAGHENIWALKPSTGSILAEQPIGLPEDPQASVPTD
ncbi:MAG: DPP IV N-terminal domain-containing protein [Phycisphaeraceae bacterium]